MAVNYHGKKFYKIFPLGQIKKTVVIYCGSLGHFSINVNLQNDFLPKILTNSVVPRKEGGMQVLPGLLAPCSQPI
jgi:hypothetical protein